MVKKVALFLLILSVLCVGCQKIEQIPNISTTPSEKSPTLTPSPTPTPFPPSPTPIPLAARVNGDVITLIEFDSELARYRAAQPSIVFKPGQAEKVVLDDLIDQILLIQQARLAGYELNDIQLKTLLDQLIQDSGGAEAFNKWLVTNGYSLETFKDSLSRSRYAAWMRDRIVASVPLVAEQVHARQIILFYADQANQILKQLQAGKDFATIALSYDPVAGGDLGWFPRGYLTESKLEDAAFSLQPDEFSTVIQTRLGYHILQVIERQVDRPLEPDALRSLQVKALGDWLISQRNKSDIEIIIDLPK